MNLDFLLESARTSILSNHPDCKNIILTGSAAIGTMKEAKDLDLIVFDEHAINSTTYTSSIHDNSVPLDILVVPKFQIASYVRKTFVSNNSLFLNMMINGMIIMDEDNFAHEAILFVRAFIKDLAKDQIQRMNKFARITIQKAVESIKKNPGDPINMIIAWKITNTLIQLKVSGYYPIYVNSDKQNAKVLRNFDPTFFNNLMAVVQQSIANSDYESLVDLVEGEMEGFGGFVTGYSIQGPKRKFFINDIILFGLPFSDNCHLEILLKLEVIDKALNVLGIKLLFISSSSSHSVLHMQAVADYSFEEVNHFIKNVLLSLKFALNTIRISRILDTTFLPYEFGGTQSFGVIQKSMQNFNISFRAHLRRGCLDSDTVPHTSFTFINELIAGLFKNEKDEIQFIGLLTEQWLSRSYYALQISMGYKNILQAKIKCQNLIHEGFINSNAAIENKEQINTFGEIIEQIVYDIHQLNSPSIQFSTIEIRSIKNTSIGEYNANVVLIFIKYIELVLSFFGIAPNDHRTLLLIGYMKGRRNIQPPM